MKRLILPFILSAAFALNAAAYDNVFDSDIFDNQTPNEEELEDAEESFDTEVEPQSADSADEYVIMESELDPEGPAKDDKHEGNEVIGG